jgi:hypothetical protein
VKLIREIGYTTIATIILKVSVTGGGLSLLGASNALALAGAAYAGIMEVAEEVSRAYLKDRNISSDDLNAIGNKIVTNTKSKK